MNFEIHFHEKLKKENHDCRTVDIQVRTINTCYFAIPSLEKHTFHIKKNPIFGEKKPPTNLALIF